MRPTARAVSLNRALLNRAFLIGVFLIGAATVASAEVSRCDLASLLIRVEEALVDHPPKSEDAAAIDARFDRASIAFFSGQAATAVSELAAIVLTLEGREDTSAARSFLASRVFASPFVLTEGAEDTPRVTIQLMIDVEDADVDGGEDGERGGTEGGDRDDAWAGARARSIRLIATLDPATPGSLREVDLGPVDLPPTSADAESEDLETQAATQEISALSELRPGRWWLRIERADGLRGPATPFYRTKNALEETAEDVLAIAAASPESTESTWLRERAGLLRTERPRSETARFVEDLYALQQSLPQEAMALARREDPFRGATGNLWLSIPSPRKTIPCRFFVPERAERRDRAGEGANSSEEGSAAALPLIIAFHGAGGDENMFAFAYGGGALLRLAADRRAVVAMPLTYRVLGGDVGATFDAVLQVAERLHPIDRDRVYVLGHSLGCAAAEGLATARSSEIAGVALLMGAGAFRCGAPTLVVASGRDPLVPGSAILQRAEVAREAGLDVTTMWLPDRGHTLPVGEVLPSVVDWLLERHRPSRR